VHLSAVDQVALRFLEPADTTVSLKSLDGAAPVVTLQRGTDLVGDHACQAALDDIVEIELPLHDLGLKIGDNVSFIVDLWSDGQSIERAPAEGGVELSVPSADFDMQMWQA
jgi:hypothetical protein